MRVEFQFIDKELEDMDYTDLRIEKKIHSWAVDKWETAAFTANRHLYWMEQNKPIEETPEEIKQRYEDGQLTGLEYARAIAKYNFRDRDYRATVLQIAYAKDFKLREQAILRELDEQIEKVKEHSKGRKRGPKKIDPRKASGRNNPKAEWRKLHPELKRQKKLKGHSEYWSTIQAKNKSADVALERRKPIANWDLDKLRAAARAIGYNSDDTIYTAVAQELEVSISSARRLLKAGNLSWAQAMLIGGLFEMTPAMFCDVFLSGYFKEIADGRFIAQVDDKDALRRDTLPVRAPKED